MLKKKNVIIIVVAVVAAIIVGGGIFFILNRNSAPKQVFQSPEEQTVLTLKPEDIGMTLSPVTTGRLADHGITLAISNITDIASIDYELSYTSKGDIPRGAIGHVDIKPTDTNFSQDLAFGTCSDVCHWDADVTDVKVTLKVTKKDGKVYSVEQSYTQ